MPNAALEYDVRARVVIDGQPVEDTVPPLAVIRQDERDIIRKEYVDAGTAFRPRRDQINPPARASFRGNYTLIAEVSPGRLESFFAPVQVRVNALLNNDVQEVPVGMTGLAANAVVVSPGAPIIHVGALGDTDPEGDDVCTGPLVAGRCNGPIAAGPNGVADTTANNRAVVLDLESIITVAYRNPRRNVAAGSALLDSNHTRGQAVDLDPDTVALPARTSRHLKCIIEQAGDEIVGDGDSITEQGCCNIVQCDDPVATHNHIEEDD
jgi:hypothetical protein